jgi:hypothetical protein
LYLRGKSNHIALRPHLSREELDETSLASCERIMRFFEEASAPSHAEDQPALSVSV